MVTALAAATVVLGAGTASAQNFVTAYHGDDYARYWTSSNNLYACDNETDGHGVRTEYWAGSYWGTISDANGSESGCSWLDVGEIDSFRVCERQVGCSDRVYL